MQLLGSQETQALVEPHGRDVGLLRLQHDLGRGDAVAAEGRGDGQHGDIATARGRSMRRVKLQFADDDPNEGRVGRVRPLAEKVAIDVDAVRLAEVLGDEGAYGGEILRLQPMLVLDVPQLYGEVVAANRVHGGGEVLKSWCSSQRQGK
ncbi:Uncharacterized protein TPAR_03325 [Tolypocladium paradoxum]|uniref:Uncharacterized protein n=1 Tax=Tolypocladium paradoxum TaxID=94208 RepID=A0A2S4L217_9HYPO|nr:Uncharacterized protein TPAR_03325 [Tolypocladium paradoxum]